jgi:hypothetical protein
MRRDGKSSTGLHHNSPPDPIENTLCVFFMQSCGLRRRPAGAADPEAFTMNSMARGTFHTYTLLS